MATRTWIGGQGPVSDPNDATALANWVGGQPPQNPGDVVIVPAGTLAAPVTLDLIATLASPQSVDGITVTLGGKAPTIVTPTSPSRDLHTFGDIFPTPLRTAIDNAAPGDLLIIGWGSTKGAIEEGVDRMRAQHYKVSSLHLQFLQPMASGIKEIMQRFKQVMTIEGNWSDRPEDEIIDENNRRYSALAILLRSRYLVDVDCWSEVKGAPIKPSTICDVIRGKLKPAVKTATTAAAKPAKAKQAKAKKS